jgi:hypothetical protein
MTPMISETARAQKGDFKSKGADELKRDKEERIKQAKEIRKEKRRLKKLEEQEEFEL